MLHIRTICFFGHRILPSFFAEEERLQTMIRQWMQDGEYTDFLVGRNGDFDQIVSSNIVRITREFGGGNSSHICVLPYETAEYCHNRQAFASYYDEVTIVGEDHPKRAIGSRNRWMIDQSDFCVFFVNEPGGGAYAAMQYAQKKQKPIVNLGRLDL